MDENSPERQSTLQLTWPIGQTFFLTMLIFLLVVGVAEPLARLEVVRQNLPSPSLGKIPRPLEIQLDRLDALVEREGGLDCAFLGAGPAWRGVDPEIFQEGFQSQTGQPIRCFNLAGVSGWSEPFTRLIADILIEQYQPRLLIVTTDAMLASQVDNPYLDELAREFTVEPWVQYQLGQANPTGWLSTHSQAYRNYLLLKRSWDQPKQALNYLLSPDVASLKYGNLSPNYDPGSEPILKPPSQVELTVYKRLYNWEVAPDSLDTVMRLPEQVPVVLVEIPLHPSFFDFLDEGEAGYEQMIAQIETRAGQESVPFWRTRPHDLIPEDGWAERQYLNQTGARVFSRWLGEQVGQAVNRRELKNPAPGAGSEGL